MGAPEVESTGHGHRRYRGWEWVWGNATSHAASGVALMLLRLFLGLTFIVHGLQKFASWEKIPGLPQSFKDFIGAHPFDGTVQFLATSLGFPQPKIFAVLLIVAELGGGLLLLLGLLPRIAAAMIAGDMVVALLTAHRHDSLMKTIGPQAMLVGALVILIAGGGYLAIGPRSRRRKREAAVQPPPPPQYRLRPDR